MVKIKVGDEVVVKKPDYEDKDEQVEWVLSMDDYEDSNITVSNMDFSCSDIFQVRGANWWFHTNWITHVNGTPVNKEKPSKGKSSKQERPYENWKMSISKDKFVRCISDKRVFHWQHVEGILGYINKDGSMFYYSDAPNKYIAAKVYPFKYPDNSEGWEFVKENCDSLQKSVVEKVNEISTKGVVPKVNAVLTKCDDEKSDILEAVESTKNGILASFGVPEKMLGNDNYECVQTYNPVKNISLEKYQRCVAKAIEQINYFNQSGELTWMFKSPCENYYYWCDYNSKNDVIYFRGEVDWVEKNYRKDNPEQKKKLADLAEKLKGYYDDKDPVIVSSESCEAIKSDGGKSDYYKINLPNWVIDKQQENGYIMLEDLAETIFDNDFNFTNVFKAQKRMFELKKGRGKAGNDFEYDAKKCHYYIDKQIEVEGRE